MRILGALFAPFRAWWRWAGQRTTTRGKWLAYGGPPVAALIVIIIIAGAAGGSGDGGNGDEQAAREPTQEEEATEPPAAPTDTPLPPEPTDTPLPPEPTEPLTQQQPSGDGLDLRVSVFDDTINRPADNLEVWLRGYGSWFPDVTFGGDVVTYQMSVTEGQPDMFIYPDGRDGGAEMPVTFQIPSDFIAGSVRDMLQISVSDSTVTVFGTVVPGLEMEFAR